MHRRRVAARMAEGSGAIELLLRDGVIMLAAALACVIPFRRLGLGAVLGYLVAGVLVGPHGFGLVGDGANKMAIAEIGIVLLLFLVGLELNPARLWRLKRDIFGLGVAQVVICGLVLTGLIFVTANFSWGAALALGLPLALSSTAQVLPSLKSSGRINSPFGEKAFSILLLQDLALVPLITIIASLSRNPAAAEGPPGWLVALYTVGAITGLVLVGRFILRPLLHLIGRFEERELFVAVGLFTVLAAAALMHALHLSTALGAFIAGVMLADSPYRHEIESDVEPFRTILLGMFFLAIGMLLDISVIAANPLFILSMALLLVVTKTVLIAGIARLFGMTTPNAFALGLLLSQGGEFGFVLFSQARDAMLIAPEASNLPEPRIPTASKARTRRPRPARSWWAMAASARPSRRCWSAPAQQSRSSTRSPRRSRSPVASTPRSIMATARASTCFVAQAPKRPMSSPSASTIRPSTPARSAPLRRPSRKPPSSCAPSTGGSSSRSTPWIWRA
jgi:monovalent cation:proton antiporter-2 (CPA2) family protein